MMTNASRNQKIAKSNWNKKRGEEDHGKNGGPEDVISNGHNNKRSVKKEK